MGSLKHLCQFSQANVLPNLFRQCKTIIEKGMGTGEEEPLEGKRGNYFRVGRRTAPAVTEAY